MIKAAIISPVYFPKSSYVKLNTIKRTLDSISYNTGINFDFYTCIDGLDEENEKLFIDLVNNFSGPFVGNKKIIKNEKNEGISVSLNRLLDELDSSYTHVCTLDLDVQLPPNWLDKCCKVLNANPAVGVCGVLVEDFLRNNIEKFIGAVPGHEHIQFTIVDSIGGACLVFNANKLKEFKYDESLKICHVDAYILSKYLSKNYLICAIMDRGYHAVKESFESSEWIESKKEFFQKELSIFYKLRQGMGLN